MSEPINNRTPINNDLANAIFNINVEKVKTLLDSNKYDPTTFDNICTISEHYCPIHWITQCWEIILENPDSWREDLQDIVRHKKKDNQEIKDILVNKLNIDYTPIDIHNNELWIYMYDTEEDFEDYFDCTKEEMLSRGHNEMNLDLYYAVNTFNFEETERLLKLGANPNYYIPEEQSWCFDVIAPRCTDYSTDLGDVLFADTEISPLENDYRDLAYLLAWAVNEKMYNLLCKYSNPNLFVKSGQMIQSKEISPSSDLG